MEQHLFGKLMNNGKIKIGIIDSGIDTGNEKLMKFVRKGISINEDGNLSDDFNDNIGHGTAVADLITRDLNERDIELFVYRAFNSDIKTDKKTLEYAFNNALKDKIDILNCSLGTIDVEAQYSMFETIKRLKENV